MTKLIKFVMAKGEEITLPYEEAQQVLNSTQQIIQVKKDGKWTGITINKAHIICTKENFETEKDQQVVSKEFRLSEPAFKKVDTAEKMKELWNLLKSKGLFREFNSYEQYREAKKY